MLGYNQRQVFFTTVFGRTTSTSISELPNLRSSISSFRVLASTDGGLNSTKI